MALSGSVSYGRLGKDRVERVRVQYCSAGYDRVL